MQNEILESILNSYKNIIDQLSRVHSRLEAVEIQFSKKLEKISDGISGLNDSLSSKIVFTNFERDIIHRNTGFINSFSENKKNIYMENIIKRVCIGASFRKFNSLNSVEGKSSQLNDKNFKLNDKNFKLNFQMNDKKMNCQLNENNIIGKDKKISSKKTNKKLNETPAKIFNEELPKRKYKSKNKSKSLKEIGKDLTMIDNYKPPENVNILYENRNSDSFLKTKHSKAPDSFSNRTFKDKISTLYKTDDSAVHFLKEPEPAMLEYLNLKESIFKKMKCKFSPEEEALAAKYKEIVKNKTKNSDSCKDLNQIETSINTPKEPIERNVSLPQPLNIQENSESSQTQPLDQIETRISLSANQLNPIETYKESVPPEIISCKEFNRSTNTIILDDKFFSKPPFRNILKNNSKDENFPKIIRNRSSQVQSLPTQLFTTLEDETNQLYL